VFSSVLSPVRHELARYGISPDAWYDTPGEALEAFHAADAAPRSTRVDGNPVENTGITGDEKAL
jgi:hypothetical protein